MAQDAFLRAFRALPGFRGQSAFSTWLTALAVNVYRSHLRRRSPAAILLPERGRPEELADLEAALAAQAAPGVDGLLAREREEAVRSEVAGLPERYREAIVLFYFEERNVEEAARVLGVPEGTLKARLHRGRKLLRQRLEGRVTARGTREAEADDTPAGWNARE
jgi:RNA polymerase sigma-70 factor (ECF subfamily)